VRLANHADVSWSMVAWWMTTKAMRADTSTTTAAVRELRLPMAAQKMNSAKDGTVASRVARMRNAAQSASVARMPTPPAATRTKPSVTGAGAVT
jgi:hypothetical protein